MKDLSKYTTLVEVALRENSPFLPKILVLAEKPHKTELTIDPLSNERSLAISPPGNDSPVIKVTLSESQALPDQVLIEVLTEHIIEPPVGAYIQRIERYDSEGNMMGELCRLRIPITNSALPDSVKYFSSEMEVEVIMAINKGSSFIPEGLGIDDPVFGVYVGGYSEQNGATPLAYYVTKTKVDGIYIFGAGNYTPMISEDLTLKGYLDGVFLKYTPQLVQQSVSL